MSSSITETFALALDEHSVEWQSISTHELSTTLPMVIEPPAIGAHLPFVDVSLVDTDVTLNPSPNELERAMTGVSGVQLAIADYGTLVLVSSEEGTEQVSLYPERHVAIVAASDIVPDMPTAFDRLQNAFEETLTSAVLATGASATADMGELVYGVHGPKDVVVIILKDL